ncbi:EscR/YscR/HrcR family type III secretion system export apparatus protein [Coralloluteibacterium stylophorae]|uniref:EscR/YscR/HrcR family type III secretion system export apparatus protein n=1 Tax=Coralloluteibacterium stylophorae TaxID=1776034 RepID=A0A8J7VXN2_9GAMM|nr:EscR/YscR/HrcR family type III secretion system export apparatus protein [Coralloluteibacterium stylophorae]MBS7458766.1 EscR/YscR/HrcR family type III secretion system export apparatus protein [Coralloluteibacterium stylophorae]
MDFADFSPALILVTVVSLALAPFVAVMVTSFTKIVVVLSLLRNALGLQQVPPNVVINGLAIVLSIYVMYPVVLDTYDAVSARTAQQAEGAPPAGAPGQDEAADAGGGGEIDRLLDLVDAGKEPLRAFLIRHSNDAERAFFLRSAERLLPPERRGTLTADDFIVIVPAFTVSELTAAFQIGFLIFLPFLIIDMVVSNILLALGMMMLSPTTVSLPFKLLLFVLVDGWAKLVHGLVLTYGTG